MQLGVATPCRRPRPTRPAVMTTDRTEEEEEEEDEEEAVWRNTSANGATP